MQKNSIKKSFPRLIRRVILVLIALILPADVFFQMYLKHDRQKESSEQVFRQLEQLMENNEKELETKREEFSELCIQRADMAAYFVDYYPEVISNLDQTRELAEKLDVDEIHFFSKDGAIYAGSHPEYFGLTFFSGEQMMYFVPMLEDTDLKLCQEITPNTAEGKEMQYAAVWLADKSGIVQIGMRPERLLKEIEERSLTRLVAEMPFDLQGYLHVVDMEKKAIVASTAENLVGKDFGEAAELKNKSDSGTGFHTSFGGERYCVYTERYGNYLLIRTYLSSYILGEVLISVVLMVTYILLVALGAVGVVSWYVNKKISNNLALITKEMKKIEEGNLESIVLGTGLQEFDDLIFYIKQLLMSIRLNWGRLSELLDRSKIPLGIFEYNRFYKNVFVNEWMLIILGIEADKNASKAELRQLVTAKLIQAESECVNEKEKVYKYCKNGETVYLRIETYADEQSYTYYVIDVSVWWQELNEIKLESGRDSLTGLYNRRGLYDRLDELFLNPERLGNGAFVMLDADGLKRINDVYGHHMGDEYLKVISHVIGSAGMGHSVTARMGGDEFLMFLFGYDSYEQILEILSFIKASRGQNILSEYTDEEEKLEFSMGYACYPEEGTDYRVLIRMADERMYQEKRKRKIDIE